MKSSKIFYGWWIVLGAAIMLAVLGPAAVAVANVYQAPVVAEFGITNSQFAISNSFVLCMGIFLSPFVSKRLAEGNFKRNYMVSLLIYAFAYMGYGFAQNMIVFYLLSFLVGYGSLGTTVLPATMLISNWFIEKRGLAVSLALSGLGVGGVVFSQFVTFFIEQVGWRQTYMLYGAVMLVVIVPILLFLIKAKPEDIGLKAYGSEIDDTVGEIQVKQPEQAGVPFYESFKKPSFILLMLGAVFVGISNNAGLGQFPPVLTNLHGPAVAATVISVYSAVGIAGKLVLGQMNDSQGIVKSTLYSSTLLALSYVFMLFSNNAKIAFIMAIFFGMGNAIGTVMPPLVTSAIYSKTQYSTAYGYVNSGLQFGMTVGSLLAAGIADLTGSYTVSWIVITVLSLLTGLSWIGAYKNAQKTQQVPASELKY